MRWESYDPGKPGAGEARLRHEAIGLNFIDVYLRSGLYPLPELPATIGMEGAGVVEEIGEGVTEVSVGDRVGVGWHAGYCMVCDQCMSGDHNLCAEAQPTIAGRHGGFRLPDFAPDQVRLFDDGSVRVVGFGRLGLQAGAEAEFATLGQWVGDWIACLLTYQLANGIQHIFPFVW